MKFLSPLLPGLLCALWLGGCASINPPLPDLDVSFAPGKSALNPIPFHAQEKFQCGPAALASTLNAAGLDVTPEDLQNKVYLPDRKGSLQTELMAATRSYERLAYVIKPDLNALLAEVFAGRPVLVLLNLGVRSSPIWHYAVVVGYDGTDRELILHSGVTANQRTDIDTFNRRWVWAGQWGMLALRPDELPVTADINTYMTAAASLEAVRQRAAARAAYQSAQQHWPDSPWPWLGLANLAYADQDLPGAIAAYHHALSLDPGNVAAHNNLAEALAGSGCYAAARRELEQALQVARNTNLETSVAASLAELPVLPDAAQCAP